MEREPPSRPLACWAGRNPNVTLGAKATKLKKLRPFKGNSLMRFSSTTVPTVAFSVLSNAPEALTSTVLDVCPTERLKSTRAVCCTWSSMFVLTTVSKPGAATFTW